MTIKKLSPDKVRITLSHEELAAYEIDWDHLGPDDEPTRELLLQLLDSAWQTAGFLHSSWAGKTQGGLKRKAALTPRKCSEAKKS